MRFKPSVADCQATKSKAKFLSLFNLNLSKHLSQLDDELSNKVNESITINAVILVLLHNFTMTRRDAPDVNKSTHEQQGNITAKLRDKNDQVACPTME